MYDQGQVSTSIYYQNDKYGWPKTIRSEVGGQPEHIKRTKGFLENSILQVDAASNDHLATRRLTLSHAIPFGVDTEHQLQEPFRFYIEDMKNMSVQDKIRMVSKQTEFPNDLDGVDDYLVTFFDGDVVTRPQISSSRTIIGYYRSLYVALSYLDVYLAEVSPKFASKASAGSSLDSLKQLIAPYYQSCMDRERDFGMGDDTTVVQLLLSCDSLFAQPRNNYIQINAKLQDVETQVMASMSRTTAYFTFRLLPRWRDQPLIDQTLLQKIMARCIEVFKAPRASNVSRMDIDEPTVSDRDQMIAGFERDRTARKAMAAREVLRKETRLQWLLETKYNPETPEDRALLEQHRIKLGQPLDQEVDMSDVVETKDEVEDVDMGNADDEAPEDENKVVEDVEMKDVKPEKVKPLKDVVMKDVKPEKIQPPKDVVMQDAPGSELSPQEIAQVKARVNIDSLRTDWETNRIENLSIRKGPPELVNSMVVCRIMDADMEFHEIRQVNVFRARWGRSPEVMMQVNLFLYLLKQKGYCLMLDVASGVTDETLKATFGCPSYNPAAIAQLAETPSIKAINLPQGRDLLISSTEIFDRIRAVIESLDVKPRIQEDPEPQLRRNSDPELKVSSSGKRLKGIDGERLDKDGGRKRKPNEMSNEEKDD